jgi:hypothetical protein
MGSRTEVPRLGINNTQEKGPEIDSKFANTTNAQGLIKAAIVDLNISDFGYSGAGSQVNTGQDLKS